MPLKHLSLGRRQVAVVIDKAQPAAMTGRAGIEACVVDIQCLGSLACPLAEVQIIGFERVAATIQVTDQADLRQAANTLWLSAREYLRRHSIAERASRQIAQRDADTLGDLQMEYELEASALLGLKHATATYQKLRPDQRC